MMAAGQLQHTNLLTTLLRTLKHYSALWRTQPDFASVRPVCGFMPSIRGEDIRKAPKVCGQIESQRATRASIQFMYRAGDDKSSAGNRSFGPVFNSE